MPTRSDPRPAMLPAPPEHPPLAGRRRLGREAGLRGEPHGRALVPMGPHGPFGSSSIIEFGLFSSLLTIPLMLLLAAPHQASDFDVRALSPLAAEPQPQTTVTSIAEAR